MPAALRVDTPDSPPLYRWIESEVVRVGSNSASEIHIDSVAPHVATIVFRDGAYQLINRSNEPLELGERTLNPGSDCVWPDGQPLTLGRGVQITLVLHNDPAPVVDMPWRTLPDYDAPERERQQQRAARRNLLCFGVTVVALFVTAVFAAQAHVPAWQQEYERLNQALADAPPTERQQLAEVRNWMQRAYSLQQRHQPEASRRCYLQARSVLMLLPSGISPLQDQLLAFVQQRLATLS